MPIPALALAYVVLFQWTYVHDIHPRWAYLGLEHHAPAPWLRLVLSTLAVAPSALMPRRLARPSQLGLWFIYLLVYVPSQLVPMEALGGSPVRWLEFGFVLLACMGGLVWSYAVPLDPRPRRESPQAEPRFWLGLAVVAAGLYVVVISSFGLPTSLPSLSEIYDVRAEFRDLAREGGRLSAYAVPWVANVINPLLIAWGATRRRTVVVGLGVAGQLLIFGLTGLKSVLLSAVLIVLVIVILRDGGRRFGAWVLLGALGVLVLGVLESQWSDGGLASGVLVRRTFMVPGQLTGLYVDYYAVHDKAWLGHSVLGGIVPHASGLAPPKVVGGQYFVAVTNANANVWADGYANFGELGMVLATGLLAAVLRLYDYAAAGLSPRLATALFAVPAVTLTNSALLTSLLTHGVLLVMVVVALLPRVDNRSGMPRST
ncbi:MAG: hypothetical protein AAF799_11485 [Myxococcota bacterium]